ncbi:unnamed protein product [Spirodela intermedia]|uniref:NAC domain-containing protein n=1 Tax=Spirodela intermedia TaxID=51605 RepID=A0A7I8KVT2_SPIIN|nr:unnamed protein product [Spirodela intermedia]
MDAKNDVEKADEAMLPGFRFHPTDEELVGFYLKRKVQKRPVFIELIRQLDIYKYDPWDLPKLATMGEKEWYFYCPRDRKYRNSARPNRVTGAGFWKATGTDRAIYASEGSICIGLKKSLVFYRGRAAKGIKTNWMMHEYRLPSLGDSSSLPSKTVGKEISASDSWAICRIFRKTCLVTQRSLSHSWVPPLAEEFPVSGTLHRPELTSEGISSCPVERMRSTQQSGNTEHEPAPHSDYSSMDITPYRLSSAGLPSGITTLLQTEAPASSRCPLDGAALLQYMQPQLVGDAEKNSSSSTDFNHHQPQQLHAFSTIDLLLEMTGNLGRRGEEMGTRKNPDAYFQANNGDSHWETLSAVALPFAPPQNRPAAWKAGLERDSIFNLLENEKYL